MASGHNDPKLLYAINGVSAYHISNGQEASLNPAGPQTLSLLMVPTSSSFADLGVGPGNAPEEDFYLHLHLPPELDLPLPATTQIYHKPPRSYLIPRWDLGRDAGAFTRIEFPALGSRPGVQEDVDTFETIIAQCTAFLERSPPPKVDSKTGLSEKEQLKAAGLAQAQTQTKGSSSRSKAAAATSEELPAYNPTDFKPGEGYVRGSPSQLAGGQIVLVDEEDGSVIGELGEGFHIIEDTSLKPGSKDPVVITLPTDVNQSISVAPASHEAVDMLMHPAYQRSFLVSNAALASRLIVTTSDKVSKALSNRAATFTSETAPATKPMTFQASTHERVRRINTFTGSAVGLSTKTVGQISKVAQNVGAKLARHGKSGGKGFDQDGKPIEGYKPGFLNKSLMAFSTVADGIDQAGRNLLTSSSSAATTVVAHKWGPEAGEVTKNVGGGFKNAALVYIDVTGVSRRALIKSVAKGMVVGRAPGGGDLIVGSGDGGVVTVPADKRLKDAAESGSVVNGGGGGSEAADSAAVDGKKLQKPTAEYK